MELAAELTPCLLVLNKLIMASEDIRVSVKKAVFPLEADEVGGGVNAGRFVRLDGGIGRISL